MRTSWEIATRRLRFEEVLLLIAAAVNVAVVLSATYFPYVDATNHLARYVFIARSWSGTAPPGVHFSWRPTGYIALDLLGAGLVALISPEITLRIFTVAAILMPSIGLYALLRATVPKQRGWALVGLLLACNWYIVVGFLSYTIGVGLAFLWLALWWKVRDSGRLRSRAGLVAFALLLYLVHLAAIAIILVVLSIHIAMMAATAHRNRRVDSSAPSPELRRNLQLLGVVLAGVAMLWVAMKISGPHFSGVTGNLEFRSPREKVAHIFAPFFIFSTTQCAILLGALIASAIALAAVARPTVRADAWLLSALGLLAAYVVFPVTFLGAYDADIRFILPGVLLAFCARPNRTVRLPRLALLVPFGGVLLHALAVRANLREIDVDLRNYHRVLATVPPNARVLPLVSDRERHGRADPYRHFIHWRAIELNQIAPGLFASKSTAPYLAHFEAPVVYNPDEKWGTRSFDPLDWSRIRREYQFIAELGDDERAGRLIRAGAHEMKHVGDVRLYRVDADLGATAGSAGEPLIAVRAHSPAEPPAHR